MTKIVLPQYDVTPKEFAKNRGISKATATRMFVQWLSDGRTFVKRVGVSTVIFPTGKLIRMERSAFDKGEDLCKPD
jgi:hypothetical protein